MKVPASIRNLYDDQREAREKLKQLVDPLLKPRLDDRWHFESRVKTLESFTLKIESGRVCQLDALEDFFAATVVVRNASEIPAAEAIAAGLFDLGDRRPLLDTETHKSPDAFPFDDLRLYVRWKDDPALPPSGLHGTLFEIQVKTFLQHAWSIATHDLTYKSDEANWSKMRIAYQIKAMLEHAEVSIQEATRLSECSTLAKTDRRTASLRTFIVLLADLWQKGDLPANVRRLAENIMHLADLVKIDAQELKHLLEQERVQGRGPLTLNLTPYGVVLQTLFALKEKELVDALCKSQKHLVIIPRELELPGGMDTKAWGQAVIFV
jgi:ppGpp synthetase/RelA/SpoT-type nucleotidyltranferase